MNRDDLKQILKARYSESAFKNLLKEIFTSLEIYSRPDERKEPDIKKYEIAKSVQELGNCRLQDKSKILFYQIELTEGKKIAHNRVGLHALLKDKLQPGETDGILASFYHPKSGNWRISYMSKSLSWDNEMKQVKTETSPRRYTFVVGESETVATIVERFEKLLNKAGTLKIDDVLEAFSVEKISDEFFEKYRHHFETFQEYLEDSSHFAWFKRKAKELHADDAEEEGKKLARNFVKKLLGRIVFLYFLQKKGWMGVDAKGKWGEGPKDFVGNLYKTFDNKKDFYAACLVPLFFETLNKKRDNDIFKITKSRIPYLNGGLFDKDQIEPDEIKFKTTLFDDLFNFFDSYNFTIDENSPEDQDIGIDPEMLGKIFENLLEENWKKGTFYTPKDVVHYMCKESLRCYIREQLKEKTTLFELKAIDAFIYQYEDIKPDIIKKFAGSIDDALSNVKICDPAIGSGAFPMGMVYEILRLKKELFGYLPSRKGFDYGKEKLKIIKNNIYGVDLDQGAIDIARLRFWLSLIVDEEEPKPLPNLDYKFMQGDSLREWYEGIQLDKLVAEEQKLKPIVKNNHIFDFMSDLDPQKELKLTVSQKQELKELVGGYFGEENPAEKKRVHKEIEDIVDRHLKANIDREKKLILSDIQRLKNEIEHIDKSLKESQRNALPKYKTLLKKLEQQKPRLKEIEEKEARLLELEKAIEKPFFLWNLFFGDVLSDNKGFDIVIGNPPYGVKVDDETEVFYGIGSKDSYGAFMSLGLKKLKPNGTLCFIVSDTWLTIKSHLDLRNQILNWQLQKVIRLHQDCFHATVNSCILTVRKEPFSNDKSNHIIAADYTNISTRKETAKFRERLLRAEELIGQSTTEFGVYGYEQKLLFSNHNHPIIVGSPKLFEILTDIGCDSRKEKDENGTEIEIKQIPFNGQILNLIRFGDISHVAVGLQTGDNDYYLYQNPDARGSYKDITQFKQYMLTEDDLNLIRLNDKLRLQVIEKGIHKNKHEKGFEKNRYFSGRFIVPYDKGGESDTDAGWLPNYYVPTDYFIDWSTEAIHRIKTLTLKEKNQLYNIPGGNDKLTSRFQNTNFYFKEGITWSDAGIYSPTIRFSGLGVFDVKGSKIISYRFSAYEIISLLCSKLARYIIKIFENHTISTQSDDFRIFPVNDRFPSKLSSLVEKIQQSQHKQEKYDYLANEQKEIDKLVYQMYNLSDSDINEVETWFARRYPKLAKYADIKPLEQISVKPSTNDEKINHYKSLITSGESQTVEFKSTLHFCLREKQVKKELEWEVMKNIAAFLNTDGGTLFIGVQDDGTILGLDDDFSTFSSPNKKDAFLKHLDNLLENYLSNSIHANLNIEFVKIDRKMVCVLTVRFHESGPVLLKNKIKNDTEEYYIRRSSSAKALTPREMFQHKEERWS